MVCSSVIPSMHIPPYIHAVILDATPCWHIGAALFQAMQLFDFENAGSSPDLTAY